VIVYGASEVHSARAARLLAGKGFSRIYHLAPGGQLPHPSR
jgi:rhodanese-related sulfurtransferase